MKILVAIPTHRHAVSTVCLQSLVTLFATFARESGGDIRLDLRVAQATSPTRARNAFASMALADPDATHLLLVDPDIGFRPSLITRMLAFDQPVVGAAYPTGTWDRNAFAAAARQVDSGSDAEICALPYAAGGDDLMLVDDPDEPGSKDLVMRDGFVRTTALGNDILLIRRDALAAMAAACPELLLATAPASYTQLGLSGQVLQCFDPLPDLPSALEEKAFSQRWVVRCGGELWACIVEPILRRVDDTVAGHFLIKLQNGQV